MVGYHRHNVAEHLTFRGNDLRSNLLRHNRNLATNAFVSQSARSRIDDGCAGALWRTEEIRHARVRDHARSPASAPHSRRGYLARACDAVDQRRVFLSAWQNKKRNGLAGKLYKPS